MVTPLALALLAGALSGCSGSDVKIRGRAIAPNGTGRFNVAVTAHLRNGEQQTVITPMDGSYAFQVKRDLVLSLEFVDEIFGPLPLEHLAGLEDQHINVAILWAPPQTGADCLARLSAIEQLYCRAAMKEELPRQAWGYLLRYARRQIEELAASDLPMPADLKQQLADRSRHLAERLEELEAPPRR
jgi:hypothetical protein